MDINSQNREAVMTKEQDLSNFKTELKNKNNRTIITKPSIKPLSIIAMLTMIVLTFSNVFGYELSFTVIPFGVIFFFFNKAIEKLDYQSSGLDMSTIMKGLRNKQVLIWMFVPAFVHIFGFLFVSNFMPDYITFEFARAGNFVEIGLNLASIFQFFVFALGEEIAWRAFFQQQLHRILPVQLVVLLSSLLFAFGHFSTGEPMLVYYGLGITFVNSILYGIVFHKSKNAWISGFSHFAANVVEIILFLIFVS